MMRGLAWLAPRRTFPILSSTYVTRRNQADFGPF